MTFIEKFNINLQKKPVILIAPLDWGLGHASRCIPIITYLNSIGCELFIACDGNQEILLQAEFPHCRFIKLRGYRITFSKNRGKTLIKILAQIPKILISINRERRWLKRFLLQNSVDFVFSDNRYGLFNANITSVFITHQLTIKTSLGGFVDRLIRKINYHYINKFSECWVPDYKNGITMGGELSHPAKMPLTPVKFLGRLSRINWVTPATKTVQLLIILSGPEPQRTILEEILLHQMENYDDPVMLIRGLPGAIKPLIHNRKNLVVHNHLRGGEFNNILAGADMVISRSGYTTIMDLIGLKKKCIFIPTPGQPEQEYLAEYLAAKNLCLSYSQDEFSFQVAIDEAMAFEFSVFEHADDNLYKKVIADFINRRVPA